jgi:hypothetical protein
MRTFYDYRGMRREDAQKYPVQGRVILKSKKYWLCWIYKDDNWFFRKTKTKQRVYCSS